ncbi:hypothetical protein OOL41_004671 [Salmonella enterica]|nr:hypothetical protein [Salmonella enterica]
MYNIHNPNYNTFLHRGGSDRYFIYTPALFVDEQVKSPSLNIKRLCEVSGGQGITEKYNGEVSVESGERVQKAFNDMKLSSFLGMYNFFNSSCLNFKKQSVAYEKQARMLDEYINKDYFYNDFSCSVNGNIKWSLSIEPVLIDKDKSGVEQLWILMTIKS